jgi:dipeptidyl aminopeptidase/acylaminoacyl peptidase
VLVVHERQGVRHPLIWDPVAQTATELKLELPGEVYGGWYPDGTALLLTHDHRGRDELYRYGIRDQQLTRLPTDPGTIFDAAVRPDGELWTWWTNAESPPAVRSNGRLVLQAPGDPAPRGVPYQDGTAGDVHFFYAEPRSGIRPHPTIFVIHGGPEAHDSDRFSPRVQAWVDHGFAVVMVNYRGSDGYGRAWRDALVGNPGLTELEDVAKVHDWMTDQGITDQRRTILSGASWGGYLTLLGIGTQPQRWPLAIADVPVGDYVAAYEDEMEPLKAMDRALVGGTPEQVPETYRRVSPITYVEQVQAPLLILAGENDPRCPIRQIDNYLARLRALGKPHEVYRFNAGHGSLRVDEQIKQVEMEIAFAARNLGTPLPL